MSYANIKTGLISGLEAVSGIRSVIGYVPTTVQETPLIYLQLDRFEREYDAQGSLYTYSIQATLVIPWQDNVGAEATVASLLEAVTQAFDADMTLGGQLTNGAALILSGDAGYEDIAGMTYRIVEFMIRATERVC